MSSGVANFNAMMGDIVPELKSKYGHYPMDRPTWTDAGKSFQGQPAFIASPKESSKPLKMDYVWGPGTRGFGYYHLTTKEAYKALAARLRNQAAPDLFSCLFCGSQHSKNKSHLKDISLLCHARGNSPVPNDELAREHAVQSAGAAFRPPDDFGLWEIKMKSKPYKEQQQEK